MILQIHDVTAAPLKIDPMDEEKASLVSEDAASLATFLLTDAPTSNEPPVPDWNDVSTPAVPSLVLQVCHNAFKARTVASLLADGP